MEEENKKQEKNSAQYPFYVHDQYIKDLSFENPNFLMKYGNSKKQPEVTVNIETNAAKLTDDNYEIVLSINVKSSVEETAVFIAELKYAGLVSIQKDLEPDLIETILLVHCPFLLFPFAREIIASTTKSGGYHPLLIDPIDFASLYLEKKKGETVTKKDG